MSSIYKAYGRLEDTSDFQRQQVCTYLTVLFHNHVFQNHAERQFDRTEYFLFYSHTVHSLCLLKRPLEQHIFANGSFMDAAALFFLPFTEQSKNRSVTATRDQ